MISRDIYIQKIKHFIGKDLVKVITGIRRSGKSSLLELIKIELVNNGREPSQFLTINFEDLTYQNLSVSEINEIIISFCAKNPKESYIFLDEVQEISGWEKPVCWVKSKTGVCLQPGLCAKTSATALWWLAMPAT